MKYRIHLLDALALALIGISLAFLVMVAHSPFSLGLLAGAAVMAAYGAFTRQKDLIAIAIFLPGFGLLTWWANYGIYLLTPNTIDSGLSRLELGAGVAIYHWTLQHHWLFRMLTQVYAWLGLIAAVAICTSHRRRQLITACVLGPAAASVFYYIFPAVGPRWVDYPAAARNCVPSMHVAWALFFVVYSSRGWRWPMAVFALLTAAATVGIGEHYVIDVVVAVPFTAALCALSDRSAALVEGLRKKTLTAEAFVSPRRLIVHSGGATE